MARRAGRAAMVAGAGLLLLAIGLSASATAAPPPPTGQNSTWTFTEPGNYSIQNQISKPGNDTTLYNINILGVAPPNSTVPVSGFEVDEDLPFHINRSSAAIGNTTLNWTWSELDANLTVFGTNVSWLFTTPGVYNLTLTVIDPEGETAQGLILMNVSDTTDPVPEILGPLVVDIQIPAFFASNASDNDPRYAIDDWVFEWFIDGPTRDQTEIGRNTTYFGLQSETVTVRLNVTDASGNKGTVTKVLVVNAPPVVNTQPPTEVLEGGHWSWGPNATDPENRGVTLALVSGPTGMAVVANRVEWTLGTAAAGAYAATVSLNDTLTTALRNFTVYVVDPADLGGDRKPVFDSEPPTDARVRTAYLYDIKVHDDDNDTISIAISGLDGYDYNPVTGRLTWMPPWQPTGDEEFERLVPVTITAFDGNRSAYQEFTIRFRNPPNQWPVYAPLFTLNEVNQGETYRINLAQYWSDPDDIGTNLTFVINDTDPTVRARVPQILGWRVEFDGTTTWLVFNITGNGTVTFNLVARDPSRGTSENATLTVNARPRQVGLALPWWLLPAIAGGLAVIAAGIGVALRRSRKAGEVARSALETASKAPRAAVPADKRKDAYVIEGALIIYHDGRMIFSKLAMGDVKMEDPELVASMFSAVQSFIKDSFQSQGELDRLGFGDDTILIERGSSIFMAAIIYGEPEDELNEAMRETIRTIENAYAGIIEEWDGSTSSLEAIDDYVEPFIALTAGRTRADVKAALTEKVVKMPSELEFFQGFVRLKCGVKNDTESVITKVTVSVDFNEDVLRLHHVEPDSLKLAGSEVQLGVLNPGEKTSVAFYFDPQICTESQIDGIARYRDSQGAVHSVSMKTRKAEVVCPIFFTKEHANTAMLKRLIEGALDQRDSKVYTVSQLPEGMKWADIFALVKEVVMGHDVHKVRDFVEERPFHGEAWFYGETKVKGYKIVIRASVLEEGKRLEFFAASTQIRAITGLLAEFNHTLQSLLARNHPALKVQAVFDEAVKRDIQKKSLLAQMGEAELAGGESDQEE